MATIHLPGNHDIKNELINLAATHGLSLHGAHGVIPALAVRGPGSSLQSFAEILATKYPAAILLRADKNNGLRSFVHLRKELADPGQLADPGEQSSFTPLQIAQIYGFPSAPVAPANIAIIELGGGYDPRDLQTYWNQLALPVNPRVIPVSVDGAFNEPGQDADEEVVLDIQIVGALVPNSNIYVYFAPNSVQGFYNAIAAAIAGPASIISISWGSSEQAWSPAEMEAFDQLFAQASAAGKVVAVASGDSGAFDGGLIPSVNFPASSPHVLACGGTKLVCPTLHYADSSTKESCWGDLGGGAAGGGYSAHFPVPAYQKTVNKRSHRGIPDVTGVGDPRTGWSIYFRGAQQVVGGTSCVAPMWAGYLARLGNRRFVNPALYAFPEKQAFHDIIIGNNQGYSANSGWDVASGLGSPNGAVLNALLSA